MKSLYTYLRIPILVLCIVLSYLILIPPVPSEKGTQQRIGFIDLATAISLALFYLSTLLFRDKQRIFKVCRYSKSKFFLLLYGVLFLPHLFMRLLMWYFGHLPEYGYPVYNVLFHSVIYSFMMSSIFYFATTLTNKEGECTDSPVADGY